MSSISHKQRKCTKPIQCLHYSYPGLIVVEGEESDVEEFTARIKALQWKALQIRCEEVDEHQGVQASDKRRHMKLDVPEDPKSMVHEMETLAQVSSRCVMRRHVSCIPN